MVSLGPLPMQVVVLLLALGVAALVGRRVAKRHGTPEVPVGGALLDVLFVGLLAGRVAFVLRWWPLYAEEPSAIFRLGDGGYSVPAALVTGFAFGAWRAWRRPDLRRTLAWGGGAGLVVWALLAGALLLMQTAAVQLPRSEVRRLEGGVVRLSELRGRPMVVNLWATWCPPCRREMPVLAQAQAQRPEIGFVFANQGEGAETVHEYLRDEGLALRDVVLDPFSAISEETGTRGLPTTLFFDAEGRLVDAHMGELTRAGLAQKLVRLAPGSGVPAPASIERTEETR